MSAPPHDEPPVVDPRLDDLPFANIIVERAAAAGATTLRQLARIPPRVLMSEGAVVIAAARAILERYLGKTWEELSAATPPPPDAPRRPSTLSTQEAPRAPTGWDELRLVLPSALWFARLDDIGVPERMKKYPSKQRSESLIELAAFSEAQLLGTPRIGRLTVHRTFLAVLAFAARAGVRVAMPPPLPPEGFDPGVALLDAWKAYLADVPPDARRAMRLRAGLDGGRPETYGAVGALLGVSPAAARRLDAEAVDLLAGKWWWITKARARFARALRTPTVPLSALAPDPWWSGIVAVPHALDYFAERVLGGGACVLDLDGKAHLARCGKA
jgi:hypothetical protein